MLHVMEEVYITHKFLGYTSSVTTVNPFLDRRAEGMMVSARENREQFMCNV